MRSQPGSTRRLHRKQTGSAIRSPKSSSTLQRTLPGSLRCSKRSSWCRIVRGCSTSCTRWSPTMRCNGQPGKRCTTRRERQSTAQRGSTHCKPSSRMLPCRIVQLDSCSTCWIQCSSTFRRGICTAWRRTRQCRGSSTRRGSSCSSSSSIPTSTGLLGNGRGWTCRCWGSSTRGSTQCSTGSGPQSSNQRYTHSSTRTSTGGSCTGGSDQLGSWRIRSTRSSTGLRAVSREVRTENSGLLLRDSPYPQSTHRRRRRRRRLLRSTSYRLPVSGGRQ
jgi:hypothetical protein